MLRLIFCGFPVFGQGRPQPGFAERFRRGYKYVHTVGIRAVEVPKKKAGKKAPVTGAAGAF